MSVFSKNRFRNLTHTYIHAYIQLIREIITTCRCFCTTSDCMSWILTGHVGVVPNNSELSHDGVELRLLFFLILRETENCYCKIAYCSHTYIHDSCTRMFRFNSSIIQIYKSIPTYIHTFIYGMYLPRRVGLRLPADDS